jgi:hypothetical protein
VATFAGNDAACMTKFRFNCEHLNDIAVQVAPQFISADIREHKYSLLERIAVCIERCVNPLPALETLSKNYDIPKSTLATILRRDIPLLIEALRIEIPPIINPNLLAKCVSKIGIFASARLLVDTTFTRVQPLTNAYSVHYHCCCIKPLIVCTEDGTLLAIETGFGGGESDNTIFLQSGIFDFHVTCLSVIVWCCEKVFALRAFNEQMFTLGWLLFYNLVSEYLLVMAVLSIHKLTVLFQLWRWVTILIWLPMMKVCKFIVVGLSIQFHTQNLVGVV